MGSSIVAASHTFECHIFIQTLNPPFQTFVRIFISNACDVTKKFSISSNNKIFFFADDKMLDPFLYRFSFWKRSKKWHYNRGLIFSLSGQRKSQDRNGSSYFRLQKKCVWKEKNGMSFDTCVTLHCVFVAILL